MEIMALSLRVILFCCFILKNSPAANTNQPVGFKSLQKCKDHPRTEDEFYLPAGFVLPPSTAHESPFPFAVLVFDQVGYLRCIGTLISDKFVLVPGHCLTNERHIMTFVKLGTHIADTKITFGTISRTILHPQYNSTDRFYSDIGLLELKKAVILSKSRQPACLSRRRYDDGDDWFLVSLLPGTDNKFVKQTKFGVKTAGQTCQDNYEPVDNAVYGIIDHLQICVAEISQEDMQLYQPFSIVVSNKDTGGFTVVGIPSAELINPTTNQTNRNTKVYTRISGYIKWIESIVWPDEVSRGCNKFKFNL